MRARHWSSDLRASRARLPRQTYFRPLENGLGSCRETRGPRPVSLLADRDRHRRYPQRRQNAAGKSVPFPDSAPDQALSHPDFSPVPSPFRYTKDFKRIELPHFAQRAVLLRCDAAMRQIMNQTVRPQIARRNNLALYLVSLIDIERLAIVIRREIEQLRKAAQNRVRHLVANRASEIVFHLRADNNGNAIIRADVLQRLGDLCAARGHEIRRPFPGKAR